MKDISIKNEGCMTDSRTDFELLPLPNIPDTVGGQYIGKNNKLLSDETIAAIKKAISEGKFQEDVVSKVFRIKRKDLKKAGINSNFHVIVRKESDDNIQVHVEYFGKRFDKLLGKGAFGKVKAAQNAETGEFEALKFIRMKQMADPKLFEYVIKQEMGATRLAQNFKDYMAPRSGESIHGMLMHLIPGKEGAQLINLNLLPVEIVQMSLTFAEKLEELHKQRNILHADIKPENFIYNPTDFSGRIIDFGVSMPLRNGIAKTGSIQGTLIYLPPYLKKLYYDRDINPNITTEERTKLLATPVTYYDANDIYSLGMSYAKMFNLFEIDRSMPSLPGLAVKTFAPTEKDQDGNEKKHPIFPDDKIRESVTNFLKRMTTMDGNQPQFEEVKIFFADIRNKLNEEPANRINVAIINIDEYQQLDHATKQDFLKALALYNGIQLISTRDEMTYSDLLKIKMEFNSYGLPVKSTLLHQKGSTSQLLTKLPLKEWDEKMPANYALVHAGTLDPGLASQLSPRLRPVAIAIKEKPGIKVITVPYLPGNIETNDLQGGGLLVPLKTQFNLLTKLKAGEFELNESATRLSRKLLKSKGIKSPFSIVVHKHNDNFELFAVYKGEGMDQKNQSKNAENKPDSLSLGQGKTGYVKLIQNLSTGEFFARKAQHGGLDNESEILKTLEGDSSFKYKYPVKSHMAKTRFRAGKKTAAGRKTGQLTAQAVVSNIARGVSLDKLIKNNSIPPHEMGVMFHAFSERLLHIHNEGVLHLDLKPENMLYDNGIASIIDFNISAKTNAEGVAKASLGGTLYYLAPEKAIEQRTQPQFLTEFDAKTDIYAFGISIAESCGLLKDHQNLVFCRSSEQTKQEDYLLVQDTDPSFALFQKMAATKSPLSSEESQSLSQKIAKTLGVNSSAVGPEEIAHILNAMDPLVPAIHVIANPDKTKIVVLDKDHEGSQKITELNAAIRKMKKDIDTAIREQSSDKEENKEKHIEEEKKSRDMKEKYEDELKELMQTLMPSSGGEPTLLGMYNFGFQNYGLVAKEDPKYINNTHLLEPKLKEELYAFLQKMTSVLPKERPTTQEVNDFLKNFSDKLAKNVKQKVAIFNLKEYEQADDNTKAAQIESLKKYDQVVVVYPEVICDLVQIQKLTREMAIKGVNVKPQLLYGSTSFDVLASQAPLAKQFKETGFKYKFFSVSDAGVKAIADTSVKSVNQRNTLFSTASTAQKENVDNANTVNKKPTLNH